MRLLLLTLFALFSVTAFAAPEEGVVKKEDGISDKSLFSLEDEHDLLKAESQDVSSEVKPLYQGFFNGKVDGNLPVAVAHPGAPRPQGPPNAQNVFANLFNGQGPVYQPGSGLSASASHVIENTVEYAPDASGSLGAASPVPPQINGQGVNGPHPPPPSAPTAGAVIPSQFQGQAQPGQVQPQAGQGQGQNQGGNEPWPLVAPDTPKIIHLDVKCEKNLMKVAVEFDKPFNGIIFSKGHYSHGNCVHQPPNSAKNSIYFDIGINSCGTTGNTQNGLYGNGAQTGSGTFFENTVVIQYDPQVQEVWDQARKLRCTWHDQYEKSVTFRPFPVDMLDVVRADFAGDNVGCWMQIQVGKGPWASEVAGIVKIGQTMTIVLAIKDEENKFDMLVRNCIAHDGKRAPIELVDSQGCIVRPKIMSKFTKIKNFGSSASVLSYAHFQAFKFPDSMEVHFQCTIQICRYQCPDQCSQSQQPGQPHPEGDTYSSSSIFHTVVKAREERRRRRDANNDFESSEIGLDKIIQVVSTGDLAFNLAAASTNSNNTYINDEAEFALQKMDSDVICMSTIGFTASAFILSSLLVATCLVAVFFCMKATQVKRKRIAAACGSRS